VWTISGRLQVRDSEIDGTSHDRPLKGIEVKVSARDTTIVPWTSWGTVRADADGDCTLQEANNGKSRFLRVRARLVGDDLEVNDSKLDVLASFNLLDENWRTVWESAAACQTALPVSLRSEADRTERNARPKNPGSVQGGGPLSSLGSGA
jgi:hypothetical protein